MQHPECPVLRGDGCTTNIWGKNIQNDRQSSESVILGVDTLPDIHVGAVFSQLGTHIIQINVDRRTGEGL